MKNLNCHIALNTSAIDPEKTGVSHILVPCLVSQMSSAFFQQSPLTKLQKQSVTIEECSWLNGSVMVTHNLQLTVCNLSRDINMV
jgi:hypothetical protein